MFCVYVHYIEFQSCVLCESWSFRRMKEMMEDRLPRTRESENVLFAKIFDDASLSIIANASATFDDASIATISGSKPCS